MKHFTENNYIVIQGWMVTNLKLTGNELIIYALIYGLSQTDNQKCTASQTYLSEAAGCDESTLRRVIKRLTEKGLITKDSVVRKGVTYNEYKALLPEGKTPGRGVGKTPGGGWAKRPPINNIDNINSLSKESEGASTLSKTSQEIKKAFEEHEFLSEALRIWLKYCKDKGIGYRAVSVTKWVTLLVDEAKGDPKIAVAVVNQSIDNGWKSLFSLKKPKGIIDEQVCVPFDGDESKLAHNPDGSLREF